MSEHVATVVTPLDHAEPGADWLARDRSRHARAWGSVRLAGDAVALAAGVSLSGAAAPEALGLTGALAAIALSLLVFVGTGAYVPQLRPQILHELRQILGGSAFAFAAVAGLILIDPNRTGAGDAAIVCWLVAGTTMSVSRLGIATAQRYARRKGWDSSRTLVIGAGKVGTLTAQRLLDDPSARARADRLPRQGAARVHRRRPPRDPAAGARRQLGPRARHRDPRRRSGGDRLLDRAARGAVDLVRRCWALGVNVMLVPRLFEVEGRRVQRRAPRRAAARSRCATTDPRGWPFAVKYVLDRVIAASSRSWRAPILAVLALAVLVSTGRPVFFRQRRVGRDGARLRHAQVPHDARRARARRRRRRAVGGAIAQRTASSRRRVRCGDDRRTRVGSLLRSCSLDELPQLWNVLRGDMSMIGPRPERAHYVELFETAIYRYPERHRVKSGLTGWAQVHGLRGETSLAGPGRVGQLLHRELEPVARPQDHAADASEPHREGRRGHELSARDRTSAQRRA